MYFFITWLTNGSVTWMDKGYLLLLLEFSAHQWYVGDDPRSSKLLTNPIATPTAKTAELQMIPDPLHDPHFFPSKISKKALVPCYVIPTANTKQAVEMLWCHLTWATCILNVLDWMLAFSIFVFFFPLFPNLQLFLRVLPSTHAPSVESFTSCQTFNHVFEHVW